MAGNAPAWEIGQRSARALRDELMLGRAPVDLRDVIARRSVDLVVHSLPPEWGDGRYIKKGERAMIVVNSSGGNPGRARFTAAHELGHHELHRHGSNFVVQIDVDILAPAKTKSRVEKEADAFAAYLLAPDEALQADIVALGVRPRELKPEHVAQLMGRYGLAYNVTVYRLHNADVIGAAIRDRLLEQGQGQVRRLAVLYGERADDAFFSGNYVPRDFEAAALKLYEHRHVELGRLAEMLRTDEPSAGELVRELGIERAPGVAPDEEALAALLALEDNS